MTVKRDDETYTEFTMRLAREEWTRPLQDENERLQGWITELRDEVGRLTEENRRLREALKEELSLVVAERDRLRFELVLLRAGSS